MSEFIQPLLPGELYHFYNRGNNRQPVFLCEADYVHFLERWKKYIHPVAETFAYCLLPNHFHAAIRIREQPLLATPDLIHTTQEIIDRGFANFFISYSRKFQTDHDSHGALFHRPFKRKLIQDQGYFDWLIGYILLNPVKHGICMDYTAFKHSSYQSSFSDLPSLLSREELLSWFGGRDALQEYLQMRAEPFELRDDLED